MSPSAGGLTTHALAVFLRRRGWFECPRAARHDGVQGIRAVRAARRKIGIPAPVSTDFGGSQKRDPLEAVLAPSTAFGGSPRPDQAKADIGSHVEFVFEPMSAFARSGRGDPLKAVLAPSTAFGWSSFRDPPKSVETGDGWPWWQNGLAPTAARGTG